MALSDAQIDRFSRQIVLPQVGGTGQERLLRSAVALAGEGELAAITALYLVAAGVGQIALHGSHQLSGDVSDLNPEIGVTLTSGALGSVDADILIACDALLAQVDAAAAAGRPLVAGGINAYGGWFVVADAPLTCASCAARQANFGVRELAAALQSGRRLPDSALRPATAGVVGSLMSIAVLKLLLGLHQPSGREWLQFNPAGSTLTPHPIARAADCPVCAVAEAP